MTHRIAAAITAIALAMGLMPLSAFAADSLSTGNAVEGVGAIATQATKKTTVYVLAKIEASTTTSFAGASGKTTTTYSYNKKGQVTKGVRKDADASSTFTPTVVFKYDGNRVKSFKVSKAGELNNNSYRLVYDKKGRWVKTKAADGAVDKRYYNKKGQMVKSTSTKTHGKVKSQTLKYAYNARGLRSRAALTGKIGTSNYKSVTLYRYDSRGNLTRITGSESSSTYKSARNMTIKNTYKKGLLKGSVSVTAWETTNSFSGQTYTDKQVTTVRSTYTYKAMRIPESVAKQVKSQQWSILNGISNNSLPFTL